MTPMHPYLNSYNALDFGIFQLLIFQLLLRRSKKFPDDPDDLIATIIPGSLTGGRPARLTHSATGAPILYLTMNSHIVMIIIDPAREVVVCRDAIGLAINLFSPKSNQLRKIN